MIRRAQAAEVRPLRHRILRPDQPFESTLYPGDDLPTTVHFVADWGSAIVGVVSLYREGRAGPAELGWRLRGMATAPEARGRGLGLALVEACAGHAAGQGGAELWCNARLAATGFYLRAGFRPVGDAFDLPGIGPHVVMIRATAAPGWGPGEPVADDAPTVGPPGTVAAMETGDRGRR